MVFYDKNSPISIFPSSEKYVQKKALLFTVDIPTTPGQMRCGTADDVFATTDFGIEVGENEMDSVWEKLREIQPTGPLVNSEFYPGTNSSMIILL